VSETINNIIFDKYASFIHMDILKDRNNLIRLNKNNNKFFVNKAYSFISLMYRRAIEVEFRLHGNFYFLSKIINCKFKDHLKNENDLFDKKNNIHTESEYSFYLDNIKTIIEKTINERKYKKVITLNEINIRDYDYYTNYKLFSNIGYLESIDWYNGSKLRVNNRLANNFYDNYNKKTILEVDYNLVIKELICKASDDINVMRSFDHPYFEITENYTNNELIISDLNIYHNTEENVRRIFHKSFKYLSEKSINLLKYNFKQKFNTSFDKEL